MNSINIYIYECATCVGDARGSLNIHVKELPISIKHVNDGTFGWILADRVQANRSSFISARLNESTGLMVRQLHKEFSSLREGLLLNWPDCQYTLVHQIEARIPKTLSNATYNITIQDSVAINIVLF